MFAWRGYLELAHDLKRDSRECAQRAALGRSYYFVYNLGLTTARGLQFTQTGAGLHGKLWRWCQTQSDRDLRRLGTLGDRMKSKRVDADYYDTLIPNLPGEVQTQLKRAREFEELVAKLTGQPVPPPFV